MRSSRPSRLRTAAVCGTVLLLAAVAACGPADRAPSGGTPKDAVDRLTAQESATVEARLDATPREIRAFLEETGHGDARDAARLADAELTLSLEADEALNEFDDYDDTRLAAAFNLGDTDVIAYKSIGDTVYLRLLLDELAREGHLGEEQEERVRELVALADDLPRSLSSAKALLMGGWVRLDAEAFEEFGWAAGRLSRLTVSGEEAGAAAALLDGRALREAMGGLQQVLTEDSSYARTGGGRGIERMTVVMPARPLADRLAPALEPLGVRLTPADVPGGEVSVDAVVRRGVLGELTVDLGALTQGGSAHVPLRLNFSSGDALSPVPPTSSVALRPQDVIATALYRAMRAEKASTP